MIVDNVTYCSCCGAEIPEGEPTHEFETGLLATKGHCHTECLPDRNKVVGQFEETFRVLTALVDPRIHSFQKAQQAAHVESRRTRPLKRVQPQEAPPEVLAGKKRARKAAPKKKATKKPAKKKAVKRGA